MLKLLVVALYLIPNGGTPVLVDRFNTMEECKQSLMGIRTQTFPLLPNDDGWGNITPKPAYCVPIYKAR